eukprot:gene26310-5293_t
MLFTFAVLVLTGQWATASDYGRDTPSIQPSPSLPPPLNIDVALVPVAMLIREYATVLDLKYDSGTFNKGALRPIHVSLLTDLGFRNHSTVDDVIMTVDGDDVNCTKVTKEFPVALAAAAASAIAQGKE